MIIKRNGLEIELTDNEIRAAYYEYQNKCRIEDIENRMENRNIKFKKPVDMSLILERVEHCLSNNDSYYESYWLTIDYVLDDIQEKIEGGIF